MIEDKEVEKNNISSVIIKKPISVRRKRQLKEREPKRVSTLYLA